MEIRLIDRHRNVTMLPLPQNVPTRDPRYDPFTALDDLLSRTSGIENGQHEFECDGEFKDALEAALLAKPDVLYGAADKPWKEGHYGNYKGVPLIVPEAH